MGEKQDRLRRLLELLITLESQGAMSLAQISARFDEYVTTNPETGRRKFERDKDTLRSVGVALETRLQNGETVYAIDARASYLPKLQVKEGDRAFLLMLAGSFLGDPSFPYRDSLRLAVRKLGQEHVPPERLLVHHPLRDTPKQVVPLLDLLGDALLRRKRVTLTHRRPKSEATERSVCPYGLFLKRGHWYLCGHDSRSEGVRVFRVSRIEEIRLDAGSGSSDVRSDYVIPEDFALRPYAQLDPVHFKIHPPLEVSVKLDAEVDHLAPSSWGDPSPEAPGVFCFETTFLPAVITQVLERGRHAELLSPPEGRLAMREALQSMLEQHGG